MASLYFSDDFGYAQEFEVAQDGVVEVPRTISGCILDDYMKLVALSELNMHLVNSHFFHPDDVLDGDRDGDKGWAAMREGLEEYMNWIYTSAPGIRSLTGSEGAGAVQRFSAVSGEKTAASDRIQLNLHHLADEAYFMVRFNEGKPGAVRGGTLEHLGGNLYLLRATQKQVTIERVSE